MKEKIKLTHEQIQKIAEGINVICFKRNPKKPDESEPRHTAMAERYGSMVQQADDIL